MGKIRIRTLGDEKQEKQEKKKAQQRAEAKKTEKQSPVPGSDRQDQLSNPSAGGSQPVGQSADKQTSEKPQAENRTPKTDNQKIRTKSKKNTYSTKYLAVASHVNKNKIYPLEEALSLLPKLQRAKFDETVELHINTQETGLSGNVVLPHGTGKEIRITIANFADNPKQVDELVKKIEAGAIDFDILIATPDSMPKLARVARILGPRGLMPNPKNGTVSSKPQEVAKKYQGGQVNFKTEAKFPLLHLVVGKVSFGEKKLSDNIKAAIAAVQTKNIKNITLKSTMSPGLKIDTSVL